MKTDPVSFKRAASVSLIGLAIQLALTLTILLYGIFGRDWAGVTGFYFMLTGSLVWVALALVFHQHRLARLEEIEADLYAESAAAQASVFNEVGDELRVASRRLSWMHRMLVPIVSLVIGAALVGLGLLRFQSARHALAPGAVIPHDHTGWAVSLGLSVAVVGFIFARFVAGMAKQTVWAPLRAGAAYMVGNSLIGLSIAVAQGAAFAGAEGILRYLQPALAIYMIALGVEVFLNFLLNMYRPRKPGEAPRPAFDSRILGFMAAPDRIVESINDAINYQFGFDVSSTWFYRLLSRSLLSLLTLGVVITWLMSSYAVVAPNETGLLMQQGRLVRQLNSGGHFKAPWPLQSVEVFPSKTATQITVGSAAPVGDEPILWTEPRKTKEMFLLVQPTAAASIARGDRASDLSMIALEAPIQYTVTDLEAYQLLAADSDDPRDRDANRKSLLQAVASRELIEYAATLSVDEILGAGRAQMGERLREKLQRAFARLGPVDPETGKRRGAGVKLLFVGVAGAHPPPKEEVAYQFEQVVAAGERARAVIARAQAQRTRVLASVAGDVDLAQRIIAELDKLEAIKDAGADEHEVTQQRQAVEALLSQAGGEAASLIAQAKADRWRRHMSARGTAARQQGRIALFRGSPRVYAASLYFDALMDAIQNARLFITTFDNVQVQFDFQEIETSIAGYEEKTRDSKE